ncbi:MAG: glycoside hydrolase family 3 C-terminal domain-containing protein [Treponema sp.]|nr:glycoside hydrolase family 3 C-terminal domain-containing protein [Treponema sp.]
MTKEEMESEIAALISEMTLEEKVSLMLHESMAVPRLGIHEYNWWNEALHGIGRAGYATIFPQTIGLAATFDTNLAQKEYEAISDEARAKYNEAQKLKDYGQFRGLTFWTPNINIFRDPRWGRGQETFGEDPYLTSQMGIAAVNGLQGDDPENLKLAACAKHFAVHSGPEGTRHTANVKPSKKDLWETYLPAFKALVDNGVESVMGAYQRLYDEPCCGSKFLLVDILRKKWGFKGHVVSDCWAVRDFHENHKVTNTPAESAALAIKNGCDLNCGCTYHAAIDAVHQGLLTEAEINTSLERLLRTQFKLGMFDAPEKSKWGKLGAKDLDSKEHRALARKVAQDSLVLLKNENGLLPLKDDIRKIMVMGPAAADINAQIGNYYGLNSRIVTILEGIVAKTETRPLINIDYHPGVGMYGPSKQRGWTVGMAESADVVVCCFGIDNQMEGEQGESVESTQGDRDTIELPEWQLDYLKAVRERGTPVVLVLTGGSPIAFPPELADAIIFAWYPGEEGGSAIGDVLFGEAIPSGHLPITFPKATSDLPDFEDYSMKGRTYRYAEKEPLFPFGFGLSYSTFEFTKLTVNASTNGNYEVSVDVKNTGKYDASEVVQLYVSKEKPTENDPICSLKAFAKIQIAAGKTETVKLTLSKQAFETITEDGEAKLMSGNYIITAADSVPTKQSLKLGASKPISTILPVK